MQLTIITLNRTSFNFDARNIFETNLELKIHGEKRKICEYRHRKYQWNM